MNDKTAKLIRLYAKKTGLSERVLKKEWLASDSRLRFQKRQEFFAQLTSKKSSKLSSQKNSKK